MATMGMTLADAKSFIVEGIGMASLLLAGVALMLIEFWGIKKIWRLMKSDQIGSVFVVGKIAVGC